MRPRTANLNVQWSVRIRVPLLPTEGPHWTFPKDMTNIFDLESKPYRGNPGPGKYEQRKNYTIEQEKQRLKERRKSVDINKIPKRPVFTDEAIREKRNAPAPGQYAPKAVLFEKVQGSVQMKTDKKSYIDDEIQRKSFNLGPGALNPKRAFYEKRVTGLSWKKVEKEDWKIQKKEGPDMGSYNPSKSYKNIDKKTHNVIISKTDTPNFSAKYAKEKAFVPPCGTYDADKCYSKVHRPMKMRF
ncbi:UNKNOWN [Stylonychia lemnae]|uniref:Uncharacterized protein n=1 Tax=Stylonychia lemnae TaxID=5949 RepID=A0A078A0Y8_STYLE|nr:UNKNOWN [Stylonychia lemnae]|eukprot:CDW75861.1 UNKNOWN [Stylonychia lemnae]